MEIIPKPILFLAAYNLIFWKKFYFTPFLNSTGELLSTFFPHWIWMSRQLRKFKFPLTDRIYYQYPSCIPFLSSFYPLHLLSSLLSSFFSLDKSFIILNSLILAHSFLGSIFAYLALIQWFSSSVSLFGAITYSYSAYMIRPNHPCIAYTMAWIPGMFIKGWIGTVSFGMAILSGYWPILLQIIPFSLILQPSIALGIVIGLPQIIGFLWYWPKSIRASNPIDTEFGKVPLWRFLDLIIPNLVRNQINGVLYFESSMFMGWIPIILYLLSNNWLIWPITLATLLFVTSIIKTPFRVPARFIYLFTVSMIIGACSGIKEIPLWLIVIQSACLLRNADLWPTYPFTEWQKKPSEWFKYKTSIVGTNRISNLKYPYFTGYIDEIRTLGYTGGFSLKALSSFHGITDPNGLRVTECSNDRFISGQFKGDILEELKCLTLKA